MADFTILNGSDDGNWPVPFGSLDSISNRIAMGVNGSITNSAFLRFDNLTIAQGAPIASASVTVKASGSDAGALTVQISANDADDPPAPTTDEEADALALTTAAVNWQPPAFTTDASYQTPDIASVIQEIVNRPGWQSGSAILLVLLPTAGAVQRNFYAFDDPDPGDTPATLSVAIAPPSQVTLTPRASLLQVHSPAALQPGVSMGTRASELAAHNPAIIGPPQDVALNERPSGLAANNQTVDTSVGVSLDDRPSALAVPSPGVDVGPVTVLLAARASALAANNLTVDTLTTLVMATRAAEFAGHAPGATYTQAISLAHLASTLEIYALLRAASYWQLSGILSKDLRYFVSDRTARYTIRRRR